MISKSLTETTSSDIHDIATALSQAFINDPLITSFFPQASPACALSYYTFRFLVSHTIDNGKVTLAHIKDDIEGAALWLPSERTERSFVDEIRYGGIAMLKHQGLPSILRQMRASKQMSTKHHELLSIPHYYLSILGLRPQAQGQGLATQLITPMLERADSEGKPCYLDTHNEVNLNLYRRYGFEVADQDLMKYSEVKHWMMIRTPR